MNVGELLRERDRLLGVIEEAKTARSRLRQINVLITMYGDDEKVALVTEPKEPVAMVNCPKCGKEVKRRGLKAHEIQMHKWTKAQRTTRAANAKKGKMNLRRVG